MTLEKIQNRKYIIRDILDSLFLFYERPKIKDTYTQNKKLETILTPFTLTSEICILSYK